MSFRAALLVVVCVAGCAAGPRIVRPPAEREPLRRDDGARRTNTRPEPAPTAERQAPPPGWVKAPPESAGDVFIVGEASGAASKDDAMERAWASALVRLGMARFPELTRVSSSSVERLGGASHERRVSLRLEQVDWTGLREATERGSPYLSFDASTGEWTAHRLLRWSSSDIERSRRRLAEKKIFSLPMPPEALQRDERRLVEAIRAIQRLNERIEKRQRFLDRVMTEVKCGITVADLIRILGDPDRFNPYNGVLVDKEYWWGAYKVERRGDDPSVAAIRREDGGRGDLVCRGPVGRSNEEN